MRELINQTAVNEAGKTQGDRLCEIKANRQHQHSYWLRPHSSSGSSGDDLTPKPSAGFVSPPNFGGRNSPAMAHHHWHNKSGGSNGRHQYFPEFSATTPIKQLKLSTTTPTATIHRHYGNGATITAKKPQMKSAKAKTNTATTTTELLRNLRTTNDSIVGKIMIGQQQQQQQPNGVITRFNAMADGAGNSNNTSRKNSRIAGSSGGNKIPV